MSVMVEQRPGFGPPTPVPISQYEAEFSKLLELYRKRSPVNVLEIGTHYGGTLYHWLQNAQPGTTVVSVDSYAVGVDNSHLYGEWIPQEGIRLMPVRGDSRNPVTLERVKDRCAWYDWVFIDAGHLYDEVRSDWEMYGSLGTGVVAFHDILWPDVARLWAEIKAEHKTLEIISDPASEWCGIGVVLL